MTDNYRFDADIALSKRDGSSYSSQIRPGWGAIGGMPNGGYVFAAAMAAADSEMPGSRPMSATAHFVRPVNLGPVEIDVELIKGGKLKSTVGVTLSQDDKQAVRILAAYGNEAALNGASQFWLPAPDIGRPEDSQSPPPRALAAAEIAKQFEYRVAEPSRWFTGKTGDTAELNAWIRFSDGRAVDLAAMPLLADAFPPSIFEVLDRAAVPTLELTVHFRQKPEPGWIQARLRTRTMIGGVIEEDVEMWDERGQLVAMSRQLALVLPAAGL